MTPFTQQAIERSVGAGYRYKHAHLDDKEMLDYIFDKYEGTPLEVIFFDPAFWQALGKAEEWRELRNDGKGSRVLGTFRPEWQYHQHRLIDHLAEGRDIESFFEVLLTPHS